MKSIKVIFVFLIIYHVNTEIDGCSSEDGTVCKTCNQNYVKNDLGQCEVCNVNDKVFFNNHCFTKIGHCQSEGYRFYRGEREVCELCESSYIPYSGKCVKLISNCESYDLTSGNCLTCRAGYDLDEGKCNFYAADCEDWNEETKKCETCRNGCLLEENGACTCYEFCAIVDQSTKKCTQCISSSLKLGDKGCTITSHKENCAVQNQETCSTCKDYYKLSSGSCVVCDDTLDNALKCNPTTSLVGCSSTKYNAQNKLIECQTCTTQTDQKVSPYNQQCTENGKYFISEGHFVDTTQKLDSCVNYRINTESEEIECSKCIPGYQLISGKCYVCPEQYVANIGDGENCILPLPNCKEYDLEGVCVDCVDGYVLESNVCYLLPTKEPTRNNSYRINLNIILIMIMFGFLF